LIFPTIVLLAATAAAQLAANPSSVNFGSVQLNSNATQPVVLTNSSGQSVTVSQASTTGTGFTLSGITLPVSLASAQSITVNVAFAPQSVGSASGSMAVICNGLRGHKKAYTSTITVPLSGNGTNSSQLNVDPIGLSFGNLQVGSSLMQSATLINSGTGTITISQAAASGSGFSMSGLNLPLSLPANQTATVNVTFAPAAGGSVSGNLTITSDASNPTLNISLSGTGVTPGLLTGSPGSLTFASVQIGSGQMQSETLTNSGGSSLTISQASITGTGFSLSGLNLPLTLAAGQGQTFNVTFSPQTAGTASGNIAVASSASNPTLNIPLSGTAVTPGYLTANPTSLDFGSVQVGSNQAKYESFTNTGGASVTITQTTASGSGFSVSGLNLPQTLNSGESVTFTATFTPTSAGSATGSISALSNASNPNLSVSLSGSATSPGQLTASPASGDFGNVVVGASQNKAGMISASAASVTVSSASSSSSEFTVNGLTFPLTLAAGQNASFTLTFTPQSTGAASASVTFASTASNSPATESLTGTGSAPIQHNAALSWSASASMVAGYNVYRGNQPGGPYNRMNSALEPATNYTDSTVQAGQTYYFVTTAVDSAGVESAYSGQVQAIIPAP
jgi:hypothetical protein